MTAVFGYYGKIPALGDFLRGGLSPDFIAEWDGFLQSLLVAGREGLETRWQDCYFSAPIWRFALAPSVCGSMAVAGVTMPSVDRVGRQFPLTLAAQSKAQTAWAAYRSIEASLPDLETIALMMLEDSATVAMLEKRLCALIPISVQEPPKTATVGTARLISHEGSDTGDLIVDGLLADPDPHRSIWVTQLGTSQRAMVLPGLPDGPVEAAVLFDPTHSAWRDSLESDLLEAQS